MRPDDTAPEGAVRIPLRARDGSVRAYALVDAADAEWVNQWRWCLDDGRYASRSLPRGGGRGKVRLHRALLGCVPGDGMEVDHINFDKLDNRRSNLRVVSKAANRQNQPLRVGTRSRYRGVSWHVRRRKWQATVTANKKTTHIGYFTNEDEAGEAARAVRRVLLPYATV